MYPIIFLGSAFYIIFFLVMVGVVIAISVGMGVHPETGDRPAKRVQQRFQPGSQYFVPTHPISEVQQRPTFRAEDGLIYDSQTGEVLSGDPYLTNRS
jgi:hypothetical protein